VTKNEVILYEEDTNNVMYMVLSGELKVVQTTESGNEIIVAIHQSGQFFGEISLIDGKTSPATVIANGESIIALISKKDFFSLLANHSQVLHNLLQILCFRLRDSWEKLRMLTLKDPAGRIRALFLSLSADTGNRKPEGTLLNVKLTHQNIADMTGLTRETVSRILRKWQNAGIIAIAENKLIRLNPDFLLRAGKE
jgi:CRP/FNR family transcriptional regulator